MDGPERRECGRVGGGGISALGGAGQACENWFAGGKSSSGALNFYV